MRCHRVYSLGWRCTGWRLWNVVFDSMATHVPTTRIATIQCPFQMDGLYMPGWIPILKIKAPLIIDLVDIIRNFLILIQQKVSIFAASQSTHVRTHITTWVLVLGNVAERP